MRDGDRTPWTDDAIRRIREAQAEGKPVVTLFECVADAIANEVEQLREEVKTATETERKRCADIARRMANKNLATPGIRWGSTGWDVADEIEKGNADA